jgi:hypothetical protein
MRQASHVSPITCFMLKVYLKYHPREHDLYEAADGVYKKCLEKILVLTARKMYSKKQYGNHT